MRVSLFIMLLVPTSGKVAVCSSDKCKWRRNVVNIRSANFHCKNFGSVKREGRRGVFVFNSTTQRRNEAEPLIPTDALLCDFFCHEMLCSWPRCDQHEKIGNGPF